MSGEYQTVNVVPSGMLPIAFLAVKPWIFLVAAGSYVNVTFSYFLFTSDQSAGVRLIMYFCSPYSFRIVISFEFAAWLIMVVCVPRELTISVRDLPPLM